MQIALLQNNQQISAVVLVPSTTCLVISGQQGVALVSQTMVGTGGAGGPYTFSAVGLPTGISLSSGGVMSGTPTVHGTFPYTVTVFDSAATPGVVSCSIFIAPPVIPPPPGTRVWGGTVRAWPLAVATVKINRR